MQAGAVFISPIVAALRPVQIEFAACLPGTGRSYNSRAERDRENNRKRQPKDNEGRVKDERCTKRRGRRCPAFLERVNGTATVITKDAILVEDDVACGTMGCGGL